MGIVVFAGGIVFAQQLVQGDEAASSDSSQVASTTNSTPSPDSSASPAAAQQSPVAASPQAAPPKHKIGPLEISINWRTRAEGWNWFEGKTGNSDYGFWDSIAARGHWSKHGEHFDWFIEGEQPSILGLPNNAVVAAPQGQLGPGWKLLRGEQ